MAGEVRDFELLEKLQGEALSSCHVALRKKLDVDEISPWMNQKKLLTPHDKHILSQPDRSREYKVDHIIEILPRKNQGWWENFIACLMQSTSGTAHDYLASTLTNQLKRKIFELGSRTLNSDPQSRDMYHQVHVNYCNLQFPSEVPSGISLDMYGFMPDVNTDVTRQDSRPACNTQWDTSEEPEFVDHDNEQLKIRLNEIEHCYNIIKNQIGLLQAFDELIKCTKHFRDVLSSLLKLYIDNFKMRKQDSYKYSQLTLTEQNVIQTIEDITESTEDIDIDKETQVWEQCIKRMENNHEHIKEALYSQDTTRMAAIQQTWKLSGTDAEDAKEWIKVRRQVVVLGYESLEKLNSMRCQDDALITSVYDVVHRRVKVGDDCLDAWIKWVQQRINL